MNISVIGGGRWGQALHFAFSQNHESVITSRTKKDIPNFVSLEKALDNEYIVMALPAQIVGDWLKKNFKYNNQKILIAAKGIEEKSGRFLNEIFLDFVPSSALAYLSGPSFAAEVMKALPTALVVSSKNKEMAKEFCAFFPRFIKSYADDDIVGAEVSGAYKNVLAIASGVCDGLDLGLNARASLIARGLVEMQRFGLSFGAKEATFLGLSGAGDLFLTASSVLSRNYRVGAALAKGSKLDEILHDLGEVAEGVLTSRAINKISKERNIYTPIAREVSMIIDGKSPLESLKDLLA
ncbi:MAG: NAD(P)H-dependent glycerol-3-phosphate dehydrogenase [Campylobacteraceae bacterium]|jgi:glycerol-3-phosphate dehydrogenase (NAD(P)+)|nr:NAD(P)H-dependent glycerol-3-phosphate dehydrogenase [Campylobacteraceae bacterium]